MSLKVNSYIAEGLDLHCENADLFQEPLEEHWALLKGVAQGKCQRIFISAEQPEWRRH